MWEMIGNLFRGGVSAASDVAKGGEDLFMGSKGSKAAVPKAARPSVVQRVKRFFTRDPAKIQEYEAYRKTHPTEPMSPAKKLYHDIGEIGGQTWGIDNLTSRFSSSMPTYSEMINVKVYGQRWAKIDDLYILAMSLLVCAGASTVRRLWVGDQAIRCTIDRTGKFVEVEFQQVLGGLIQRALRLSLPPVLPSCSSTIRAGSTMSCRSWPSRWRSSTCRTSSRPVHSSKSVAATSTIATAA
jgi:hypothetical protein